MNGIFSPLLRIADCGLRLQPAALLFAAALAAFSGGCGGEDGNKDGGNKLSPEEAKAKYVEAERNYYDRLCTINFAVIPGCQEYYQGTAERCIDNNVRSSEYGTTVCSAPTREVIEATEACAASLPVPPTEEIKSKIKASQNLKMIGGCGYDDQLTQECATMRQQKGKYFEASCPKQTAS